jgi:hypothetical protein
MMIVSMPSLRFQERAARENILRLVFSGGVWGSQAANLSVAVKTKGTNL